jgi:hypothetical protein
MVREEWALLVLGHLPQRAVRERGRLVTPPPASGQPRSQQRVLEAPQAEERVAVRPRPVEELVSLVVAALVRLVEDPRNLVVSNVVVSHGKTVERRKTQELPVWKLLRLTVLGGDGGNRTHVRDRAWDGIYERSRRSSLAPRSPTPAGLQGASPNRCPPIG